MVVSNVKYTYSLMIYQVKVVVVRGPPDFSKLLICVPQIGTYQRMVKASDRRPFTLGSIARWVCGCHVAQPATSRRCPCPLGKIFMESKFFLQRNTSGRHPSHLSHISLHSFTFTIQSNHHERRRSTSRRNDGP